MSIQLADIWVVAGMLLGFQVASFTWRISREIEVGQTGDLTWLPPADILNLISMVVIMTGVFVFPILGFAGLNFAEHSFGLAAVIFIGYPFALAGHYEMYNNETSRSYSYFPFQEKIVVALISILAFSYIAYSIALYL